MKHEQLLNEVFKFIKLIPEKVLSESVDNIDYGNRSERRKYDKLKTLDSRIEALLKSVPYRVALIETLFKKYADARDLDESLTYEEIIQSM